MIPKIGMKFYHSRVLDPSTVGPNPQPQLYQVTRITRGWIYYHALVNHAGRQELVGRAECISIGNFPKLVKEDETGVRPTV